jgi:ketosteroid isomerase-like protein
MQTHRKLLIISLLIVAATLKTGPSTQAAADDQFSDRIDITKALTDQQIDWNQEDIDTFMTTYWHSPNVTFSGTSGIVRGWDAVLARYKKSYANREAMGQLEFSGLEFHFLGKDGAVVLGHWQLTRKIGDVGGVFTLVWQKFPEGWRIIHDHTSAVPDTK